MLRKIYAQWNDLRLVSKKNPSHVYFYVYSIEHEMTTVIDDDETINVIFYLIKTLLYKLYSLYGSENRNKNSFIKMLHIFVTANYICYCKSTYFCGRKNLRAIYWSLHKENE